MNYPLTLFVSLIVVLFVVVTGCTGDILTKAGVGNFGSTPAPAAQPAVHGADAPSGSTGTDYTDCMNVCTQYSGQNAAQCTQTCCLADCSEASPGGSDACIQRCLGVNPSATPLATATFVSGTGSGFTCDYDENLIRTSSEFRVWFNTSCYYNTYCGWWESADLMQSGKEPAGTKVVNVSPDSLAGPTPTHTPCPARTLQPATTTFAAATTTASQTSETCGAGLTQCRVFSTNYCVDLMTDVKHCGACRKGCVLAHADNGCLGGVCFIKSCEKGWADCNGKAEDGCEVDLNADDNNCGTCGKVCSLPNAGHAVCNGVNENGKCEVEHCVTGWTNANGIHEDGCEAPSN
ncbi:MAG: hypothetical protein GYA23_08295 [Methanomicrobiales archaeon]|nr:hypothetical protein [Methanomicrobiales archaeon]